jgi:hypothetical protein
LSQLLGLVANLGVLVGVLLLVYELNQNREMMRAQTRHDISSEFVSLMTSVAENEGLANLVRRGILAMNSVQMKRTDMSALLAGF